MVAFLALATMLAASSPSAVVLKPAANMYSGASEQSDVVSQALYGTAVRLIEEHAGWARVETPDRYIGWIPEEWVRPLGESEAPYASQGRVAQISSLFSNVYQEPDVTKHQPLLTLPFEARLEVVAEPEEHSRRWLQVRLADGRLAWMQRGDAGFDTAPLPVAALVEFSKRFLGLPYLWGGSSTFGYDCSGFAQMLCRRRGVLIPRDAGPQARWEGMAAVERPDLQPGDFVYFGSSLEKITHTGMYLGGGEFISATTHEQPVVRIDRLEDPYWASLYVCARRLK
jgi:cell wall-associated NlpC family hydrolase